MEAVIFDIKRFAIHDGPGIRQTIFMKGCPLSCWWCHNPESRKVGVEFLADQPAGTSAKKKATQLGRKVDSQYLLDHIVKDVVFYQHSGGGVTFSGGEPLLQLDFLSHMLSICKENNIHTCVDTSGFVPEKSIRKVENLTDIFLYDLKHMDDDMHQLHTGVSNKQILSNLKYLVRKGNQVHVRFPLVPGVNDDQQHLIQMGEFLVSLDGIKKLHILPYHKMAKAKYKKFTIDAAYRETEKPDAELLHYCLNLFDGLGIETQIGG